MQQPQQQQQHLLNQQQQQQRHPAMQQSQQHQLHPRSQHPQQQQQQQLNLNQKQQQQAPQTGGFLNSLLNRPIDSSSGPNLGESQQQSNQQQQLYLAAQQPPPQLQQHRPNQNPVQKLSLNNQQQLSAAMNSSGGFNISLHPQQHHQQQQQQQQQQQHQQPQHQQHQHQLQHPISGSMVPDRSLQQTGGAGQQRSGMSIQPQQPSHSNSMMTATSLESSDGTYSVHADFMTPLDVQMASVAGWGDTPSMDPELSDIIEQVIDMDERYESDSMIFGELTSATPPPVTIQPVMSVQSSQNVTSVTQSTSVVGPSGPLLQMDMSKEKLAITAIQKSLMSYEKISPVAQSPPAYNLPGYAQQGQGAPMRMSTPSYGMNSPSAATGSINMANQQQANLTMPGARKQKLPVQQRRLLNRQQQQPQDQQQQQPPQQQLLGVLLNESSVQHTQGPQLSPGALQIMDDLLNDIPPNMTISR
jgi:hypothetical protein